MLPTKPVQEPEFRLDYLLPPQGGCLPSGWLEDPRVTRLIYHDFWMTYSSSTLTLAEKDKSRYLQLLNGIYVICAIVKAS